MNEFREKIKLQNLGIAVCSLVLAAFSFLSAASEAGYIDFMQSTIPSDSWQSGWRGFCAGVCWGFLMVMIFILVRNILALLDEKKLKKLFVKANDERTSKIWTEGRAFAMQISLFAGLVAAIVAGYFNPVISVTIIACIFVESMIGLLCVLYFSRKF